MLENNQNVINWEAYSYEGRQRKLRELQEENKDFESEFSSHKYTSSEDSPLQVDLKSIQDDIEVKNSKKDLLNQLRQKTKTKTPRDDEKEDLTN